MRLARRPCHCPTSRRGRRMWQAWRRRRTPLSLRALAAAAAAASQVRLPVMARSDYRKAFPSGAEHGMTRCAGAGLSAASNGAAHGLAHGSMGAPRVPDAYAAPAPAGPPAHLPQRQYGDGFQVCCGWAQQLDLPLNTCLVARLLKPPSRLATWARPAQRCKAAKSFAGVPLHPVRGCSSAASSSQTPCFAPGDSSKQASCVQTGLCSSPPSCWWCQDRLPAGAVSC